MHAIGVLGAGVDWGSVAGYAWDMIYLLLTAHDGHREIYHYPRVDLRALARKRLNKERWACAESITEGMARHLEQRGVEIKSGVGQVAQREYDALENQESYDKFTRRFRRGHGGWRRELKFEDPSYMWGCTDGVTDRRRGDD